MIATDFALELQLSALFRSAVSALGVSTLLVIFLNKYLWRIGLLRKLLRIKIPYVRGRWEGYVLSSYSKHQTKHPVAVEFEQDLNRVDLWYYDENAVTNSLVADFANDSNGGPVRLYCVYRNQPIRTDQKRLKTHHGAMELTIEPSGRRIVGVYYNNSHQRGTYGDISLTFISRKLIGAFK